MACPGRETQSGRPGCQVTAKNIVTTRDRISLEDELAKLSHNNVRAITENDPEYPARLKEIHDYPPLLYVRGELVSGDEWAVAVSRHPAGYNLRKTGHRRYCSRPGPQRDHHRQRAGQGH